MSLIDMTAPHNTQPRKYVSEYEEEISLFTKKKPRDLVQRVRNIAHVKKFISP